MTAKVKGCGSHTTQRSTDRLSLRRLIGFYKGKLALWWQASSPAFDKLPTTSSAAVDGRLHRKAGDGRVQRKPDTAAFTVKKDDWLPVCKVRDRLLVRGGGTLPSNRRPQKITRARKVEAAQYFKKRRRFMMAIIPWSRKEERSLAERGDPSNHLRHQINRVFDDFWGEPWLAPGRETTIGF
jgi:hypothetical protein